MTKRILALALGLALVGVMANAELGYRSISVTTTSGTYTLNAGSLTVVNDGSSSIYVRVFWEGEDVESNAQAATSANAEIKSGESLEFSRSISIKAVSIVSASTSTVRLYYW